MQLWPTKRKDKVKEGKDINIIVYELGDDTFDVSVLQLSDDLLEDNATNGNIDLGECKDSE